MKKLLLALLMTALPVFAQTLQHAPTGFKPISELVNEGVIGQIGEHTVALSGVRIASNFIRIPTLSEDANGLQSASTSFILDAEHPTSRNATPSGDSIDYITHFRIFQELNSISIMFYEYDEFTETHLVNGRMIIEESNLSGVRILLVERLLPFFQSDIESGYVYPGSMAIYYRTDLTYFGGELWEYDNQAGVDYHTGVQYESAIEGTLGYVYWGANINGNYHFLNATMDANGDFSHYYYSVKPCSRWRRCSPTIRLSNETDFDAFKDKAQFLLDSGLPRRIFFHFGDWPFAQ